MSTCKQLFIQTVKDWCNDPIHGYDQAHRDGNPNIDCSSFMYIAARIAGYKMPSYNGSTWSMLSDFKATGWSAVAFDGNLSDCAPGCIALNVANHTEAFVDWNTFGGAHIDERGCIANGQSGDQTGNEVSIGPAYVYSHGWDYILIPPDDSTEAQPVIPAPTVPLPFYRAWTNEEHWLDWMNGLHDDGGSGDDFAGIPDHWIYDLEFRDGSLGPGGWWKLVLADGRTLGQNERNVAHNSPVVGIIVYYKTPDPGITGYYKAKYQVHWLGPAPKWGKWEYDDEDGGAGKDKNSPLDMVRCTIAAS